MVSFIIHWPSYKLNFFISSSSFKNLKGYHRAETVRFLKGGLLLCQEIKQALFPRKRKIIIRKISRIEQNNYDPWQQALACLPIAEILNISNVECRVIFYQFKTKTSLVMALSLQRQTVPIK